MNVDSNCRECLSHFSFLSLSNVSLTKMRDTLKRNYCARVCLLSRRCLRGVKTIRFFVSTVSLPRQGKGSQALSISKRYLAWYLGLWKKCYIAFSQRRPRVNKARSYVSDHV